MQHIYLWLKVFATLLILSCSPSADSDRVSGDPYISGYTPSTGSGGFKRSNWRSIPVHVGPRSSSFAFSLAGDATNFSILLDECASGWTTTATAATPSLDVYKDDRGCLAKLTSYQWKGKTYVPRVGSDFTTWQADDTAIFENSNDNSEVMFVRVVSTLDDPVSGTEEISYLFYEVANGGDVIVLEDDVGDPHALSVSGQSAPDFSVYSVTYLGTTATGGGRFQFVLECNELLDELTPACGENDLANITYKLVLDDYGSEPTITDAKTIFVTPGTPIDTVDDLVGIGGSGTVNGGFVTVELEGPDQMHLHPNMILILRVDGQADDDLDNDSFTYFNVDVETLSYP